MSALIVCGPSGRFSLMPGANGSGKTTVNEVRVRAHVAGPRLVLVDAHAPQGKSRAQSQSSTNWRPLRAQARLLRNCATGSQIFLALAVMMTIQASPSSTTLPGSSPFSRK